MTPARWLITLVSFAVAIGVSAMIVGRSVPAGGLPALGAVAHVALLVVSLAELSCRGLKILLSARALGVRIGFGTAVRTVLGGDFAAAITPARAGAEPARYLVLTEAGVPLAERLIVLFLELFLELLSLLVVCGGLALAFRGTSSSMQGLLGLVGGYATFVLSVGAVGLLLARRDPAAPPPPWLAAVGVRGARWTRIGRFLGEWRTALGGLARARRAILALSVTGSVLHVLLRIATLPLLVWLADPGFTWTRETLAPLVLWPLALFYGSVVVPAPSGGGAVEAAFAVVLRDAIPAGLFAAALLWWRFYTYYLYMLLGGLAAGRTVMRALQAAPLPAPARVAPTLPA